MSVGVFVAGGLLLAIACALVVVQVVPAPPIQSTAREEQGLVSIDYANLKQGTNLAELERGRVYFAQLCVPCHGASGDGHGEWAFRISPRPRDLKSERVRSRSNAALFKTISKGLYGTSMTGFEKVLSERQRWQLVVFLRYLQSAPVMPAKQIAL